MNPDSKCLTTDQQRLVADNVGLVAHYCNKVSRQAGHRWAEFYDELYGWGIVGLCNAALTFDPDRGFQFSTYAYRCIINAVASYGGWCQLSVGPRKLSKHARFVTTNSFNFEDGHSSVASLVVPDPSSMNSDEQAEDAEDGTILFDELKALIHKALPERDAAVFLRHYLDGISLREISFELRVSKQRVLQICQRASNKIRTGRWAEEFARLKKRHERDSRGDIGFEELHRVGRKLA